MGNILEVEGVEKKYPGVIANRDVSLHVREGSIHAIIGENGAGKSTLMKTLYGLIRPDSGSIKVFGQEVNLKSPQDAISLGIGMVHQHFKLADNATVQRTSFSAANHHVLALSLSMTKRVRSY